MKRTEEERPTGRTKRKKRRRMKGTKEGRLTGRIKRKKREED